MAKNQGYLARFQGWFVALPDTIKTGITAVVVFVVTAVFAWLVGVLPFLAFLQPYVTPVALALAASVIGYIEKILPSGYPEISIQAIRLILMVLAAFGIGQALALQGIIPSFFAF